MKIDSALTSAALGGAVRQFFEMSRAKILSLQENWDPSRGTPVFTIQGKYTSRGWTEWTQGFQFGMALLQFDATDEALFLNLGRENTMSRMASHVSHSGVHDHGFNNVSTYGNLRRLMLEGRFPENEWELSFYEMALKASGATQASRWTELPSGEGYIYSFNGPHSLFVDTIRSLRVLALAHELGHVLMAERDRKVSLFQRLLQHARTTARYNIYYGKGRDAFDLRGRTAHESIFNTNDGSYRCPNSQQGYSPFSTWTRGLAWAVLGFAELLEYLSGVDQSRFQGAGMPAEEVQKTLREAAVATADFYIENSCADGIPMWDTGAPNLHRLGDDYLSRPADPFNAWEPVDSSAAAIAAQGLIRLGNHMEILGLEDQALHYRSAGFSVAATLLREPYLSVDPGHQGLLLHSVYHRPNGWDYIAPGQKVPNGESSMWGDYHMMELALLLLRLTPGERGYSFW